MPMSERAQKQLRDWLMFAAALAGTGYEALVRNGDRPFLLTLYASMMGLPLILGRGDGVKPAT
jgi:hypothetical protein